MSPTGGGFRAIALGLYAVATVLSFPHASPGGGVIDLGWMMSWVGPAGLVAGIGGLGPRRAAGTAFLASLITHAVVFHWFYVVTVQYGGLPIILGLLSPLLPALYVSLFTALFALVWTGCRPVLGGLFLAIWGATLWVAVDFSRAHFLGGFPWATLGYGLHLDGPLVGVVPWLGVYGLSFAAALVGIGSGLAIATRGRVEQRALAWCLLIVASMHGLGAMSDVDGFEGATRVPVAAIQGNVDQAEKWDVERSDRIVERYLELSEEAALAGAEWIVWPETAVPGLIEGDPVVRAQLARLAGRYDVSLVVGAMGVRPNASGTEIAAFYDSAFIFDPDGEISDRYDKSHLVPFGEYLPLRAVLGWFFESLATGLAAIDVTAGAGPRLMVLDLGAGSNEIAAVGVPICYELIFPHLVRRFGQHGGGALLAITNDAWYGRTGAPHQFLAMTAMRSAEIGRWTLRSANTGVSALIDARGRVIEATPLFEESILLGELEIPPPGAQRTFYARYGDVFAMACVGWVVLGVGRARRARRFARLEMNEPTATPAANSAGPPWTTAREDRTR